MLFLISSLYEVIIQFHYKSTTYLNKLGMSFTWIAIAKLTLFAISGLILICSALILACIDLFFAVRNAAILISTLSHDTYNTNYTQKLVKDTLSSCAKEIFTFEFMRSGKISTSPVSTYLAISQLPKACCLQIPVIMNI